MIGAPVCSRKLLTATQAESLSNIVSSILEEALGHGERYEHRCFEARVLCSVVL